MAGCSRSVLLPEWHWEDGPVDVDVDVEAIGQQASGRRRRRGQNKGKAYSVEDTTRDGREIPYKSRDYKLNKLICILFVFTLYFLYAVAYILTYLKQSIGLA